VPVKPEMTALLPGGDAGAHSARPVTSLERALPSTSSPDLAALVEAVRGGNEAAFRELYRRLAPAIFDYLVGVTRDRAEAEDLLQQTFLDAWRGLPSLRDAAKARAWLYGIARHVGEEYLRSRTRQLALGEVPHLEASGPLPEDAAVSDEAVRFVWAAAASLEAQHQEALNLSLRHGLTNREIGGVLDLPPGRVADLLMRSREALGWAVRLLFITRSSASCAVLRTLAPQGAESLTAEQRRAVDRHVRQCKDCRDLGLRLTKPEELFGAIVLATLPSTAKHAPVIPGSGPQLRADRRPLIRAPGRAASHTRPPCSRGRSAASPRIERRPRSTAGPCC